MRLVKSGGYKADKAWGSDLLQTFDGLTTVKLHWTDKAYVWHANDGPEVLAVMDGSIDMHVRREGREEVIRMEAGDLMHFEDGDEHYAQPLGEARLLVIERAGTL